MTIAHAPMATGLPNGVTDADIRARFGGSDSTALGTCECGCGKVWSDSDYIKGVNGELFVDTDCVFRFFELEYVWA